MEKKTYDHKKIGGMIERGTVSTVSNGAYTIASLDRDGIMTPPLLPLNTEDSFSVGDRVYYFYFADGTGRIIGQL